MSANESFNDTVRNKSNTVFKKKIQKNFESKLNVNYSMDQDSLKPFNDP